MYKWIRILSAFLVLLPLPAYATPLDLTTDGASGNIGIAFFIQTAEGSGTGVFQPFLRLQAPSSEMGVNSDGPYTMDEMAGPWTHELLVGDLRVTDLHGVQSVRFVLDIDETHATPLLSLDQLILFAAPVGTYNTLELLMANAEVLYDMGAGNKVLLNYALEPGNGDSDMAMYLPYDEVFRPHLGECLYLFCEFGASGGEWKSDDGFEEWATRGDDIPPELVCCIGEECLVTSGSECEDMGGTFLPDMDDCGPPNPCELPEDAPCCLGEDCFVTTEQVCSDVSGTWHPEWEDCGPPNPCVQVEAACCVCAECFVVTEEECERLGGDWLPDVPDCDPNPCQPSPTESGSWGWIKSIYR